MAKKLTLVTCLYDLVKRGRTKYGHQGTCDWLFSNSDYVLGLNHELVVFTEPELADELRVRRGNRLTKIVTQPFEELLRTEHLEASQRGAIHLNASKTKATVAYVQLTWAKQAMLEKALEITDASHIGWIDLGLTHVAKLPPVGVDIFADPYDLPHFHVWRRFSKKDVDASDYWHYSRGHIAGGLIVGARDAMQRLARDFWAAVDCATAMGRAPLEEGLLAYVVAQRPNDFTYSYGHFEDILRNHDTCRHQARRSYGRFYARRRSA